MHKYTILLFLALVACGQEPAPIEGSWEIFQETGRLREHPPVNANWTPITSPQNFQYSSSSTGGDTFWLKTQVRLGSYDRNQANALLLDLYPSSNVIFLDGERIGQSGDPYGSSPYSVRLSQRISLLPGRFFTSEPHELVIGLYKADGSEKRLMRSLPKILPYEDAKAQRGYQHILKLDLPLLSILVLLWMASYFYIFFFFRRKLKRYFHIAMVDFFSAIFIFLDSWKLSELGIDSVNLFKLSVTTAIWIIYFLFRFFGEYFGDSSEKISRLALVLSVAFTVGVQIMTDYSSVQLVSLAWFCSLVFYFLYFGKKLLALTGVPKTFEEICSHGVFLGILAVISYDVNAFVTVGNVPALTPFFLLFFSITVGYKLAKTFGSALYDRSIHDSLVKKTKELEETYQVDHLTRVLSRRYFERAILGEELQLTRSKEYVCMAILDVDHFKNYNDQYGHLKGDRLLTSIGWILNAWKTHDDLVFRIGGEEFVMVMRGKSLETCLKQIERLRINIENFPFDHTNLQGQHVTASIGVALFTSELRTMQDLYQVADQRLYEAKKTRNTVMPRPGGIHIAVPATENSDNVVYLR